MKEIYVSWVKGLPQSKVALRVLRESGIVSGVEMANIDESVEMVKDAGLKFSSHTPCMGLTLNLAASNYMQAFDDEQGQRLLDVIRNSDAPTVGFHCGYSAESVYKMNAFPNVSQADSLFTDRDELMERIVNNVVSLEKRINGGIADDIQKQVILETLDYNREKSIPWEVQPDEIKAKKEDIEKTVKEYGINAGILYVTDPSFIRGVLHNSNSQNIKPVGFLFDVGHVLISADAKIHKGEFKGAIEDYFDEMLEISNGRTYQMHLTVPGGNNQIGYADHHHIFTPGERLSDYVIELAKKVVKKSPELLVVTLEMRTGLEPREHAKEMVKQAEYTSKQIM